MIRHIYTRYETKYDGGNCAMMTMGMSEMTALRILRDTADEPETRTPQEDDRLLAHRLMESIEEIDFPGVKIGVHVKQLPVSSGAYTPLIRAGGKLYQTLVTLYWDVLSGGRGVVPRHVLDSFITLSYHDNNLAVLSLGGYTDLTTNTIHQDTVILSAISSRHIPKDLIKIDIPSKTPPSVKQTQNAEIPSLQRQPGWAFRPSQIPGHVTRGDSRSHDKQYPLHRRRRKLKLRRRVKRELGTKTTDDG